MFKFEPMSDETLAKIRAERAAADETAELALELKREAVRKQMALARLCKGEQVDPNIQQQASQAGKRAAEIKKIAKEAVETKESLRRIQCGAAVAREEAKKPDPIKAMWASRPLKPPPPPPQDFDEAPNTSLKR